MDKRNLGPNPAELLPFAGLFSLARSAAGTKPVGEKEGQKRAKGGEGGGGVHGEEALEEVSRV